ncbi:MAG: cbb3-type cytochrome c oxidase subunit II [Actinobacteria bacterium]|nr:cbb3-type cytochrome c oxidase subunit II [Actinomycetota bacterium]
MSDLLTAAAAALGVPETLVKRAAAARAAETGASTDDILAAWAGGEPMVPTGAAPPPSPPEPEAALAEPSPVPEIVVDIPSPPPAAPAAPQPTGPYKPPVLVGVSDNPIVVLVGVIGLFLVVFLVGLVGPSVASPNPGARTSEIDFSETASEGRGVYVDLGCAACHTQMVRPVVADVGLGGVTLNDTNQVLGTRRFGPDLSNVGARMSTSQIEAVVTGFDGHPAHALSAEDMASLMAYLAESVTMTGGQ